MTREELIAQMAADAKTTKVTAKAALGSFIDAVTKTLKKGGRLSLVGFGTFTTSKRNARTGRNPKTGEPLQIKARRVAKFKAGSALSKAVNGNK
jgi:DNA-binding protein HU-beta